MFGLEQKVEKAARKAAAFSAGSLLAMVGIGFLTAAGYMLISELRTPLFAVTALGLIYLGLAALAFAVGAVSREKPKTVSHTAMSGELTPLQMVAVSFLQGLEQGRRAKKTD